MIPYTPSKNIDNGLLRIDQAHTNLKAYRAGKKPRFVWSDGYFDFMQKSIALLQSLSSERDATIAENQCAIRNHEITVLETIRRVTLRRAVRSG